MSMGRLRQGFCMLTLLALAVTARAWQPAGWTYWDWPWAHDPASGDWHWFSADGAQWMYAFPPGTGWAQLPQSGIAHGWSYWDGEWAYDGDSGAWCWRNAGDTQWCVNMRTGQWARFGTAAAVTYTVVYNGNGSTGGVTADSIHTYGLSKSLTANGFTRTGYMFAGWATSAGGDVAYGNGQRVLNLAATQGAVVTLYAKWTAVPAGMVLIPGGTNSGTNPLGTWIPGEWSEGGEEWYDDWYPQTYSLTVEEFCMDRYEVTKAKWDEVYTWAIANGYSLDNAGDGKTADHPVHNVSWHDVVKWCNARSEKEGRPAVYTVLGAVYRTGQNYDVVQTLAAGYRLPTEVEWEYAARGGLSGQRFPWGDSDEIRHSRANYASSSGDTWNGYLSYDTSLTAGFHPMYSMEGYIFTAPVGSFAANGYGLYDMAGNVKEWCFDLVAADQSALDRVVRGGSWNYGADFCRVGQCDSYIDDFGHHCIGFRSVLPPGITAPVPAGGLYLVIDLSGGASAPNYPVTALDAVPPGGWTDEHKTTKLVLRRIPAGTFTMGSPADELGHGDDETQHQVTLTSDYYIGVFEVTQRQWELVMGTRPSYFTNETYYATRPVEQVSYYQIREVLENDSMYYSLIWPASSHVYAYSFIGNLRTKTGLSGLDLPTESQWEYACRAGTTLALNSGLNLANPNLENDPQMDEVGRYWYNGGSGGIVKPDCAPSAGTALAGSYQPNAWGLYDMHGNVEEWCLDWYGSYPGTVTDPPGASSGSGRVVRGGSWLYAGNKCRSACRGGYDPYNRREFYGFRACCAPPGQ